MGYEFTCSLPMVIGAIGLAIYGVIYMFHKLGELQQWGGKQINKNKIFVVVQNDGKKYKYQFSTVKEAAANAIERVGKGENVWHIEKGGEKVWDAFSTTNKQSLWKLSGGE